MTLPAQRFHFTVSCSQGLGVCAGNTFERRRGKQTRRMVSKAIWPEVLTAGKYEQTRETGCRAHCYGLPARVATGPLENPAPHSAAHLTLCGALEFSYES